MKKLIKKVKPYSSLIGNYLRATQKMILEDHALGLATHVQSIRIGSSSSSAVKVRLTLCLIHNEVKRKKEKCSVIRDQTLAKNLFPG